MADDTAVVGEAVALLEQQLARQPQPCIATASIVLGVLQERVFTRSTERLEAQVQALLARFDELLVAPSAPRLAKCKRPQDKVVALAKLLRGKLAKAPAHKQPLHTQYLPSALKDTGKRQLDCLGIATAVLAACHMAAAQWPDAHRELAHARMMMSDDHCWIALPQQHAAAPAAAAAGAAAAAAAAAAADAGHGSAAGQQQQLVHVEVTDPRELAASQLCNTWLYAGGHGLAASPAQVVLVLVAGLMPEEVQDEAAAERLRRVQLQLLARLATQHPAALFYSNFFRWGMCHEEDECAQLAAAAEAAAATGDLSQLQPLATQTRQQLTSQQHYATAMQRSSGWQWHPSSCAAFGWLNRMQAALCGDTDDLLALAGSSGAASDAGAWLDVSLFLLRQALACLQDCTAVLRQYSGCADKPDKAADAQLLEAVRDLWENLADGCKAVACLSQLPQLRQAQQQQQRQWQQQQQCDTAAAAATEAAAQAPQHEQAVASDGSLGRHVGADVPAAAAVAAPTAHLSAAVSKAAGVAAATSPPSEATRARPISSSCSLVPTGVLADSQLLLPLLEFLDALLCFYGEASSDVPSVAVAHFLAAAGTFTGPARQAALAEGVARQRLHCGRLQALLGSGAWADMAPELQALVQMPGSRKRKR